MGTDEAAAKLTMLRYDNDELPLRINFYYLLYEDLFLMNYNESNQTDARNYNRTENKIQMMETESI